MSNAFGPFAQALGTVYDAIDSWFIDLMPKSRERYSDGLLRLGQTLSEPALGLHLTPVAIDTAATPPTVSLYAHFGAAPGNQPPQVTLSASSASAAVNAAVTFTASANDPNGDALAYAWDLGDGRFVGQNAPTLMQSFSAAGVQRVRVRVSDLKGGLSSAAVDLTVGTPSGVSVRGRVLRDGQPLENVRISNGETGNAFRGAMTDTDGRYAIHGLVVGSTLALTASRRGHTLSPGFSSPLTIAAGLDAVDFSAVAQPVVSVQAVDAIADPNALVRLTRSTALTPLRVYFRVRGSATSTLDFTLSTGSNNYVEFAAGELSRDIQVTGVAAAINEPSESFRIALYDGAEFEIAAPAFAQVNLPGLPGPSNDAFANAAPLSGLNASASGTTLNATLEPAEPLHGANLRSNASIWWKWTAPTSGPVNVRQTGTTQTLQLDAYTGAALPALIPVAFAGPSPQARPEVNFFASAGRTYHFVLSADSDFATGGAAGISLTQTPGPGPDLLFADGFGGP
jgi:hypothetical protein